ncbi:hypothetical protein B0H13DRAFT_2433606 [Mycena leptocephala]|nr:hypothetical protein B0H13DRAFT_2433606 [Mycena leptocephala]
MYDRIEDMNLKIENLESALLASTSGQILSDKDQQVVIQARNNNINSMLRAVMYSLMAISNQDTSVLPDPIFKNSGGASVFWVPTGIPDEEALRSNFNVSWTKNKPWHSQFLPKSTGQGYFDRDQNYLDLIDDIDVRSKSFATSEKTSKKTSKKYEEIERICVPSCETKETIHDLDPSTRARSEDALLFH